MMSDILVPDPVTLFGTTAQQLLLSVHPLIIIVDGIV